MLNIGKLRIFSYSIVIFWPCNSQDERKTANEALILFFDVKCGRASYIEAAQRHDWPSYYQIKKAKESMLYPKEICYGDAKVEVSLASLIAHSTGRLLEFFYENNSPVVHSFTEEEKMSLELWAKVGGDGQVGKMCAKYYYFHPPFLYIHRGIVSFCLQ
jgi:hypothetical protein